MMGVKQDAFVSKLTIKSPAILPKNDNRSIPHVAQAQKTYKETPFN